MEECKNCGEETFGSFKTGLCRKCFVTIGNPFRRLEVIKKVKEHQKGKTNSNWKGNKVSYRGLHNWLRRNWGKPSFCEYCKSITKNKYDWANITGIYTRERKDYKRLCRGCHIKLDRYHSISF